MAKELKIRITNPTAVEQALMKYGAKFTKSGTERHTYYRQPEGHVLKVLESDEGDDVIEFERQGAGFVRTRKEAVNGTAALKQQLESEHGVEDVLSMTCRTFANNGVKFSLYHIANVGDFLTMTAEDPDPAVFDQLGLPNAEQITVPFHELPKLN